MLKRFSASKRMLQAACGALVCLSCTATPASAQTDYKEVAAADLLANPKLFWSLGVVFKDKLVRAPGGRDLRLGDKRYVPLETAVLGTCYATPEAVAKLKSLAVNRDYLFRGTVLNKKSSFYVVVGNVAEAMEDLNALETSLFRTTADPFAETAETEIFGVEDMLTAIHRDLFAHAEEQHIPLNELLRPHSPHEAKVMDMIYAGVRAFEMENKTTAVQILGQFIRDVLAEQYSDGLPAASGPAPVPAEVPVAAKELGISLKAGLGKGLSLPARPDPEPVASKPEPKPAKKPALREGLPNHNEPVGR